MSEFRKLLATAYSNAYDDLGIKKKYTDPKIYDAGGDLSARWYVYYNFIEPATGKPKRQTPIYAEVNRFKTVTDRRKAINILRKAVQGILEGGYDPYTENNESVEEVKMYNIPQAVALVLSIRKGNGGYADFKSRVSQFEKWLLSNGFADRYINSVKRITVIKYLNTILEKSSARNRNNTRTALSMFFATLKANEIVENNIIDDINIMPSRPERNKTYTSEQKDTIFEYLDKGHKVLLLYIKFISYNFLRPIEVSRLKVGDVNLNDKLLYVRAKNKPVKTKLLPQKLVDDLPDLSALDKDAFLFTKTGHGEPWDANEESRRDYYSAQFKKIKDLKQFKLDKNYGFYSFRHTFITNLYREFRLTMQPFEAKSKLMLITGHDTMTALEKYLRDIDAELPEDYSEHIK